MKNEDISCRALKPLGKINENQKLPKPLIEKKRRARINKSLSEIRILISDLLKKELTRTRSKRKSGKIEKADVLELTVKYIREMKQEKSAHKGLFFEQGYHQCLNDVNKFFRKKNSNNDDDIKIIEYSSKTINLEKKESNLNNKINFRNNSMDLINKELSSNLSDQLNEHLKNFNVSKASEEHHLMIIENQNKLKNFQNNIEHPKNNQNDKFLNFEHSPMNQKLPVVPSFIKKPTNYKQNIYLNENQFNKNTPKYISNINSNLSKDYSNVKKKDLSNEDELYIRLYNETVMNNLNNNKNLNPSISPNNSCSINSYSLKNVNTKNQLPQAIIKSDFHTINNSSSLNAVNSLTTVSSSSLFINKNKKISENIDKVYYKSYPQSNSPFKKRKLYNCTTNLPTASSSNIWRPW